MFFGGDGQSFGVVAEKIFADRKLCLEELGLNQFHLVGQSHIQCVLLFDLAGAVVPKIEYLRSKEVIFRHHQFPVVWCKDHFVFACQTFADGKTLAVFCGIELFIAFSVAIFARKHLHFVAIEHKAFGLDYQAYIAGFHALGINGKSPPLVGFFVNLELDRIFGQIFSQFAGDFCHTADTVKVFAIHTADGDHFPRQRKAVHVAGKSCRPQADLAQNFRLAQVNCQRQTVFGIFRAFPMPSGGEFVAHGFSAGIALTQFVKVFVGRVFTGIGGQIDLAVSKFGAIGIGRFIGGNSINNFFAQRQVSRFSCPKRKKTKTSQQNKKHLHSNHPHSTVGTKSLFRSPPGWMLSTWKSAKSTFADLL